jgi:hypothetical protein
VTTLASKSACCSAGLIFSSSAAVTTFPGIDARSVAIAALRNEALGRVVLDDHARVLKLLVKRHRDLGRLKNKSACRLHALLMELEPGGMAREMTGPGQRRSSIGSTSNTHARASPRHRP